MTDHPILFTGDMVRAILTCAKCGIITLEIECPKCGSTERLKTQTRRIAKLPEKWHRGKASFENNPNGAEEFIIYGDCGTKTMYCPHGRVGDTLWVRETWWDLGFYSKGKWFGRTISNVVGPEYVADGEPEGPMAQAKRPSLVCKWRKRPSIHMPRWACRIFLEITNIRVERVQEISAADAVQEGCPDFDTKDHYELADKAMMWFEELWDSINSKRKFIESDMGKFPADHRPYMWKNNPWVWVVEFKRIAND